MHSWPLFQEALPDVHGLDLSSVNLPSPHSSSLSSLSAVGGEGRSCCCSVTQSCPIFAIPWTTAHQASLSFTISQSLRKLMSIESVMPSNHLVLCHSLLLLPSVFPSIKVFSNDSTLRIRWAKYWNFSFSISPSNDYSRLISFRTDWFDLLAVLGTLKSLLQHHSSKASILWRSAFFTVQLSHPYMTTGRIIAVTIQASVGKRCLCFLICCLGLS